ncbi:MAG: hypothetical protein Q9191_006478 [Dirinaria sp. TL-2023a]
MDDAMLAPCAIAAIILGVVSHLFYFIHGEHHTQALLLLKLFFLLPPIATISLIQFGGFTFGDAATLTAAITASYCAAIWTSMVIYRVFFHRLGQFPGPHLAKVSKFYHSLCCYRMDNHKVRARWHEQYGDFVRIGPNELSIISPNAQTTILGPASPCLKSPWYDYVVYQNLESLHSARDEATHEARRKIWDRGFSMRALRDYESRITKYTEQLVSGIRQRVGQVVNASDWFLYYGFDVMGDLAFGQSFEMLVHGQEHHVIKMLHSGMLPLGMLSPVVWTIPVLAALPRILQPGLAKGFLQFISWCTEQVEKRRLLRPEIPDITSWLLADLEKADNPAEAVRWLHGDSRLIVVAGSDTVAVTLTHAFYHLAANPSHLQKLRSEIKTIWPAGEPFNVRHFQNAEYLNGVINEALRMHPAVPSGVQRVTPSEGITVDGVYVPGGVNVAVPNYAISHSSKHYINPDDFIPERWSSQPDLVKSQNAFAPFSLDTGPFGCIGRNLALMEMRAVIAMLVSRFDIRLAEGEDGSGLLEGSVDCFTLGMVKGVRVVFEECK